MPKPDTARSAELTHACLDRIAAFDGRVNAVLALDPAAAGAALAADARRAAGAELGPLDGIPVLVKDNIDTAGLASTAGSRVLAAAPPPAGDAPVVAALRAAGAVPLGKTNLTEWANFRSPASIEGWSGLAGQTRNPHALGHSPWGSSAGSAAAVAAGFAPLALGTETDGSIVCPAGVTGVVGIKPEHGLLPLDGIAPLAPSLDTVGVFARSVGEAARCLAVLSANRDLTTAAAFAASATAAVDDTLRGLRGRRLAIWRVPGMSAAVLDEVAPMLKDAGVELIETDFPEYPDLEQDLAIAVHGEFALAIETYLCSRPGAPSTLAELIAANRADPIELSLFGQETFEYVVEMDRDEIDFALEAGARARAAAREALDATVRRLGVDAVLAPSNDPAWELVPGRPDPPAETSSTLAALAGYPNLSLPAAYAGRLPLGLSVFGPARLSELLLPAARLERLLCPEFRPAELAPRQTSAATPPETAVRLP
jgi:amidase